MLPPCTVSQRASCCFPLIPESRLLSSWSALAASRIGQTLQLLTMAVLGLVAAFIAGWKLTLVILCIGPLIAISGTLQLKFMMGLLVRRH